jgi:hypothetical protein
VSASCDRSRDRWVDIVGSAVFVIGSVPAACEFAITIAANYGGAGSAAHLLTVLIDAGAPRGLREMEGFVLAVNKPMRVSLSRVGFSVSRDPDDAAVRVLPTAPLA